MRRMQIDCQHRASCHQIGTKPEGYCKKRQNCIRNSTTHSRRPFADLPRNGLISRTWPSRLIATTSGTRPSLRTQVWPFDLAWDVDSQTLASNLFASSIIPYAGFLYHLQKSKRAPQLMLFGFRFLLVFVLATIIAGIYAKLHYNSILANVDWLHGSAESFLTLTNLFIVLGLRQGIRDAQSMGEVKELDKATALKEESDTMK